VKIMSDLVKRIDDFIAKQMVRIGSREEAEAYGIKLPPDFEEGNKPKWEGDKTQSQQHAQATGERPAQAPKLPKVPKPKAPKIPKPKKSSATKSGVHYQRVPNAALDEVAHQLTPKGPGYHSIEDIASDVRESQRLGRGAAQGAANLASKIHSKLSAPKTKE
jgi:hypothetical protein